MKTAGRDWRSVRGERWEGYSQWPDRSSMKRGHFSSGKPS